MDTNEISNGLAYGKVNNMFSQVIEMLEDINNKQLPPIEVDFTPITEKLNCIIDKPEVKDFTAEQKKYFSEWIQVLFPAIIKKLYNTPKLRVCLKISIITILTSVI